MLLKIVMSFMFVLLFLGGVSSMLLCRMKNIPYYWKGLLIDGLAISIGLIGFVLVNKFF
jgi:hypothetical protein